MDNPSHARLAAAVMIGIVVALMLVMLWMSSAGETWSSDPWLMNTALVVMLCGPVAVLLLAFVWWLRKK